MRDEDEIKEDHVRFTQDLKMSVEKRLQSITSCHHINILEVFDAVRLVEIHRGSDDKRLLSDGDYDEYGVGECKEVLKALCKLDHIKKLRRDFNPNLAHRYILASKDTIGVGIWKNHSPVLFFYASNGRLKLNGCSITDI